MLLISISLPSHSYASPPPLLVPLHGLPARLLSLPRPRPLLTAAFPRRRLGPRRRPLASCIPRLLRLLGLRLLPLLNGQPSARCPCSCGLPPPPPPPGKEPVYRWRPSLQDGRSHSRSQFSPAPITLAGNLLAGMSSGPGIMAVPTGTTLTSPGTRIRIGQTTHGRVIHDGTTIVSSARSFPPCHLLVAYL